MDDRNNTVSITTATLKPSSTLPRIIIHSPEPAPFLRPEPSGFPQVDRTPILGWINNDRLNLIRDTISSEGCSETTGIQYRRD